MCGIGGFINTTCDKSKSIKHLLTGLAHRGPDGSGFFSKNECTLVHTRLSIIDVSEAANQPLFNEDKTIVLICNGEIYNFQELRRELLKKGHSFSSNSDSEVIIHLYEENPDDIQAVLHQLRGMFAFALLDTNRMRLILARDRFGIKPLYFVRQGQGLAFASEIKPLVRFEDVDTSIDYTSLFEYFQFLSIPEPNTIYNAIKAIPAGSYGIYENNDFHVKQWYELLNHVPSPIDSKITISNQLQALLVKTVQLHMLSDVPLGSFLSAGIDSTLITYLASKHSAHPFTCISAGFRGEQEDESLEAEETARQLDLPFKLFDLNEGFFNDADHIIQFFDQPFGVASAFSLYRISQLARKHMKVVLTGDGGDEVFAGYDHKHKPFFYPKYISFLPESYYPILGRFLLSLPYQKFSNIGKSLVLSKGDKFLNRSRILSSMEALELLQPEVRKKVDQHRLKRVVDKAFRRASHLDPIRQLLFADFETFLKSEMLYKVDRMSMANGIEARVPFLDHKLVELAFSVPIDLIRGQKYGKKILREQIETINKDLAWRKKTGFNAPVYRWLQEKEETRLSFELEKTLQLGLDANGVEKSIKAFKAGRLELGPLMVALYSFFRWNKKNENNFSYHLLP